MNRLMNTGKTVLALLIALTLAVSPAVADPPPGKGKPGKTVKHGKAKNSKKKKEKDGSPAAALVYAGITLAEARRLALDYHCTGYSALPPGIAKNLARGKPLPPGIAKKTVPAGLRGHLPHHAGYEWRVAGTDLVLVATATGIVADVLAGVFR